MKCLSVFCFRLFFIIVFIISVVGCNSCGNEGSMSTSAYNDMDVVGDTVSVRLEVPKKPAELASTLVGCYSNTTVTNDGQGTLKIVKFLEGKYHGVYPFGRKWEVREILMFYVTGHIYVESITFLGISITLEERPSSRYEWYPLKEIDILVDSMDTTLQYIGDCIY